MTVEHAVRSILEFANSIIPSLTFILITLTSLLPTVNPLGASTFFISHPSIAACRDLQKKTAKKASLAVFIVLIVFSITGEMMFKCMGITLTAFQIAGGVFVFGTALDMLKGKHVRTKTLPEEQSDALEEDDISIIPLAMPLLAGPGSITMVIVLMGKAYTTYQSMMVCLVIILVSFISYGVLRYSHILLKTLKPSGVRIMNRVMGLIIAAIAVQMVLDGMHKAFPITQNLLSQS